MKSANSTKGIGRAVLVLLVSVWISGTDARDAYASGTGQHSGVTSSSCEATHKLIAENREFQLVNKPDNPPNIIILLIDALRPDHLGCYGYARPTSPFIDSLAEEGTRFTNAYVHTTQTILSTSCLFTGAIPPVHGVRLPKKKGDKQVAGKNLGAEFTTLAELLKGRGYSTSAIMSNYLLTEEMGFRQGFDEFHVRNNLDAGYMSKALLQKLGSLPEDKPYFLYLHYMDAHTPYRAPEPYTRLYRPTSGKALSKFGKPDGGVSKNDLAYSKARYDGQINYLDDQFRLLWLMLEERGRLDNTLAIILADHGEEFLEHEGFGHATSLYDEQLRIPLIFWYPDVIPGGAVRREMVMHTDLFPTLAALAGASTEGLPLGGIDLFSARDSGATVERRLYCEVDTTGTDIDLRAIRTCRDKLIYSISGADPPIREYYDLAADPSEKTNIYRSSDPRVLELQSELLSLAGPASDSPQTPNPTEDKELMERLKSLGYIP